MKDLGTSPKAGLVPKTMEKNEEGKVGNAKKRQIKDCIGGAKTWKKKILEFVNVAIEK